MHPFALLTEAFADGAREGHDVVAGLFLDLFDAGNAECGVGIQFLDIFGRHNAQFAPCLGGEQLDLEVGLEFGLLGPDIAHYFSAITFYHDGGNSLNSLNSLDSLNSNRRKGDC